MIHWEEIRSISGDVSMTKIANNEILGSKWTSLSKDFLFFFMFWTSPLRDRQLYWCGTSEMFSVMFAV